MQVQDYGPGTGARGRQPPYVGCGFSYGKGGRALDQGFDVCATENTADGMSHAGCEVVRCIGDETSYDVRNLRGTHTNNTVDYFSYEASDVEFAGNVWVGLCKNRPAPENDASFCPCGGTDACMCKTGARKQAPAEGSGHPPARGVDPRLGSCDVRRGGGHPGWDGSVLRTILGMVVVSSAVLGRSAPRWRRSPTGRGRTAAGPRTVWRRTA